MKRCSLWLLCSLFLVAGGGAVFAQRPEARASRPELVLQIGHVNAVTTLAWSHDGKIVASGSKDQSVKLWNSQSGALLLSLTTRSGPILAIAFSPDSRTVYSASQDGSVRAWNVLSGALVGNSIAPVTPLTAAALSCTAKTVLVASAADQKPITLWRTDAALAMKGEVIGALKGHEKTVQALAFSPDGKLLASGSDDGAVKTWDTSDGSLQRTLRGHAMPVHSVAFSSDSALLADASDDGITQVWNLETGKAQQELQMNRPGDGIASVAFSSDGHTVATGGNGGIRRNEYAMLWDAPSAKQTKILLGHKQVVTAVAFSPDGTRLATGSRDNTVRLWDTASGKQTHLVGSIQYIPCIAYSHDGSMLASGSADSAVRVWNARTGELQQVLLGHTGSVDAVAFAPDGKTLASGSADHTVRIWNLETQQLVRTLKDAAGPVNALAFSPDGTLLAGGIGADVVDGALQVWDVKTGTLKQTLNGESLAMVRSVAWSADGKNIATGSGVWEVGEVRIWNAQTGALLMKEFGHAVRAVAYSADGKILVTGSATLDAQDNPVGDELKVWNARTRELQQTLMSKAPDAWINGAALLSDGKTVVTGSRDNQIRLWNAKTDDAPKTLSGPLGQVLCVAASPDGKTFAGAGLDNAIRVWSVGAGSLLATLIPLASADPGKEAEDWITVTPDGVYDASPGADRFIQWRVGPDLFPVESYEQTLHHPDLLRKALDDQVVPETPDEQKFTGGQSVPPAITFTDPHEGQQVAGDTLTIHLDVTDVRKVARVEVLANGRPVGAKPLEVGAKPLEVGAKRLVVGEKPIPAEDTILEQFQIQVPLPPGERDVTLTALAYDADGVEAREEIHVIRTAAAATDGNLYVLSVGVSQYRNPKFNLKYASHDADSFAALWKSQEGGLYQHVIITQLLDDQATSANIRVALSKLVGEATEADTVALFFSGHGIEVNDTDYYFATQEIDPATAASVALSALPWTALETTLASVRAKRVLMFLDACHSGNVLGGSQASSERMAELLVKRAGVMVFASSRGSEYSYELDSIRHGAFTAALGEGLGEGKADFEIGGQRTGVISAEGLLAYLRIRVPQLSGNRQTPSCPLLRDFGEAFPIARAH